MMSASMIGRYLLWVENTTSRWVAQKPYGIDKIQISCNSRLIYVF